MSLADDLYMLICQLLCCGCNLFMCTLAWSQLKSAFEWYICRCGAAERDGRRLVINVPKSQLFYTEPRLNSHKNIPSNIFPRRKSTVCSSYLQLSCINHPPPLHWFGLKRLLTWRRGRKAALTPPWRGFPRHWAVNHQRRRRRRGLTAGMQNSQRRLPDPRFFITA